MISMYVPTLDHPPWWFLWFIVVLVPISIYHERHWRRTLAAYAQARRDAGASDEPWPSREMRWVLSLQPWLILFAAFWLFAMVALGIAAMVVWPSKMPGFDEVINYYDRPYLSAMLTAGVAAVIGAVALAIDLARSPWAPVAHEVRRCTHARPEERARRFVNALACDPGVPHDSGEPAARADAG
jgi:hypothetical protein